MQTGFYLQVYISIVLTIKTTILPHSTLNWGILYNADCFALIWRMPISNFLNSLVTQVTNEEQL